MTRIVSLSRKGPHKSKPDIKSKEARLRIPSACEKPSPSAALSPGRFFDNDSIFPPILSKGGHMNLTISGHHSEVTPALREYVLTKLDRVTRHFDQVVDVNVLLTVEKNKEKERRQRAEVTLHVKGRDIFVESSHEDLLCRDRPIDGQARPTGRPPQDKLPEPPPRIAEAKHCFHRGRLRPVHLPRQVSRPLPGRRKTAPHAGRRHFCDRPEKRNLLIWPILAF